MPDLGQISLINGHNLSLVAQDRKGTGQAAKGKWVACFAALRAKECNAASYLLFLPNQNSIILILTGNLNKTRTVARFNCIALQKTYRSHLEYESTPDVGVVLYVMKLSLLG